MLKRRSHNKSRRGCQSCKKRHIKCDEKQPQCTNCHVRDVACVYQLPLSIRTHVVPPSSKKRSEHRESQPLGSESAHGELAFAIDRGLPASAAAFSSAVESDRLLELELMHRWSTRSWSGIASVPEDQEYLQIHLPRAALTDAYLLNILLATAASDLSKNHEHHGDRTAMEKYNRAASHYSARAIENFCAQLKGPVTQEKVPFLYHFAVIAAICNYSVRNAALSTFDRINALFDMIVGTYTFLINCMPYLPDCFKQVMEGFDVEAMRLLDIETQNMLDKLTSVSCQLSVAIARQSGDGSEKALACDVEMYRIAVAHIKHSFAQDIKGRVRGACFSIVMAVDAQFFQAVKSQEPMALVIMLFYGVLLHKTSRDPALWWLDSAGRSVVEELCALLEETPITRISEALEIINWTRKEVDLSLFG